MQIWLIAWSAHNARGVAVCVALRGGGGTESIEVCRTVNLLNKICICTFVKHRYLSMSQ